MDKPLPEVIHFRNEKREVIEQTLSYDWKISICDISKKYGHTTDVCRRNKVKELKVVQISLTNLALKKGEMKICSQKSN